MSPAVSVRNRKASRPELYCPDGRCLHLTGGGACPKHGGPAWTPERAEEARRKSRTPPGAIYLTPYERAFLVTSWEQHGGDWHIPAKDTALALPGLIASGMVEGSDPIRLTDLGLNVARVIGAS